MDIRVNVRDGLIVLDFRVKKLQISIAALLADASAAPYDPRVRGRGRPSSGRQVHRIGERTINFLNLF